MIVAITVAIFQILYSLSIFAFSSGDGSSRTPISSSIVGILFSCFLVDCPVNNRCYGYYSRGSKCCSVCEDQHEDIHNDREPAAEFSTRSYIWSVHIRIIFLQPQICKTSNDVTECQRNQRYRCNIVDRTCCDQNDIDNTYCCNCSVWCFVFRMYFAEEGRKRFILPELQYQG